MIFSKLATFSRNLHLRRSVTIVSSHNRNYNSTSFILSSANGSSTRSNLNDQLVESLPTEGEWASCTRKFLSPLQVPVRGSDILNNPLYNKGTAFKSGERDRLRFRKFIKNIYC